MTEQALFILASLIHGERHGYAIARDVAQMSAQRVVLTAGTLYGALTRLTADGLISQDREEIVGGRRRRYYHLTGAGRAALEAQTEHLRTTAAIVDARLAAAPRQPRLA